MGTSKILIDGVGIDLTQDTVAANKMLSGTTAHNSNGDSVTGSIATWAGTQASGTKNIAANGTYDVTEFASAVVNVHKGEHYEVWEGIYTLPTSASSDYNVLFTADTLPQSFKDHWQDDTFSLGFKMTEIQTDISVNGWFLSQGLSNYMGGGFASSGYCNAVRINNGSYSNQSSPELFRDRHTRSNYAINGQVCYENGELRQYQIASSFHIPAGRWVLMWSW